MDADQRYLRRHLLNNVVYGALVQLQGRVVSQQGRQQALHLSLVDRASVVQVVYAERDCTGEDSLHQRESLADTA